MPAGEGRFLASRYRLMDAVGRGGMGTVWHARDEALDRDVAVKEVHLHNGLTDLEREIAHKRTLREARTAARLSHPGVVTVYDVVEQDGRPWIVMELVRARSLAQIVAADGPVQPSRVADIGRQMLSALRTAHAAGVLHRDVKPSNVLITEAGRAVLTDFGIATSQGEATLTQTGLVMGSPAYIAPERARGKRAQPPSDLWSLGVTLYTALAGQSPFERSEPMASMLAVITDEPVRPRGAGRLWPVLDGLMRKDPTLRLTASRALELLEQVTWDYMRPSLLTPRLTPRDTKPLPSTDLAPPAAPATPHGKTPARKTPARKTASRKAASRKARIDTTPAAPAKPFRRVGTVVASTTTMDDSTSTRAERAAPADPDEQALSRPEREGSDREQSVPGQLGKPGQPGRSGPEPSAGQEEPEHPEPATDTRDANADDTDLDDADLDDADVAGVPEQPAGTDQGARAEPADSEADAVPDAEPDTESETAGAESETVDTKAKADTETETVGAEATAARTGADTDAGTGAATDAEVSAAPRPDSEPTARLSAGPPAPASGSTPPTKVIRVNTTLAAEAPTRTQSTAAQSTAAQSTDAQSAAAQSTDARSTRAQSTVAHGEPQIGKALRAGTQLVRTQLGKARLGKAGLRSTVAIRDGSVTIGSGRAVPIRNVLVGAAVAVVLIVVAGWTLLGPGDNTAARSQPSAAPSRSVEPGAPGGGTPNGGATGNGAGGNEGVPPGFRRYRDRTGFSVAVPKGWAGPTREGSDVFFYAPDRRSYMQIAQSSNPKSNALADWRKQERAAKDSFRGYKRIRLTKIDYKNSPTAADWEFSWSADTGRRRILDRGFVQGKRGYAILLAAPDKGWADTIKRLQPVLDSFTGAER